MILRPVALVLAAILAAFPLSFSGRVTRVDYMDAVIVVRTSDGDRTVAVTPSTEIDGPDGTYATLDDIHPGTSVDVRASVVDGTIVAQIISIR